MIKTRTFRTTAARDGFAITVAEDSSLVGVSSNGGILLSRDPAETLAKFVGPLSNSETDSAIIVFGSFLFTGMFVVFPVQLRMGESIYLCQDSAGYCQLWFDTAEPS
jgi:hypothetical protein